MIAKAIPQDNYRLYLETAEGKAGYFDVKPYLDAEAFAPLKEKDAFQRIYNGGYFIEWDCGADLSADTLLARWQESTIPLRQAS